MKNALFLVLIYFCFLFPTMAQDFSAQKSITKNVVTYFENGQTLAIYDLFDETMKSAITAEKLAEIWKTLPSQVGNYVGDGEATASEAQGMIVVNHMLDFENIDLNLKLAFNQENKISGLFFLPVEKKKG